MNERHHPDGFDELDPELAHRFATRTPTGTVGDIDADLAAVRRTSAATQRRRIFAGTAAAGLLVIGGGALAIDRADSGSTVRIEAAASIAEEPGDTPADAGDPVPSTVVSDDGDGDRTDDTDNGASGDDPTTDPDASTTDTDQSDPTAGDGAADRPFDDFPLPDLPELPDLESADADDWAQYQADVAAAIEAWAAELQAWFEEQPPLDTWFDDWPGPELSDEWTTWFDDWKDGTPPEGWPNVTVTDGTITIDRDGDGEPDETIELDDVDWQARLDELLADLDAQLVEIDLPPLSDVLTGDDIDLDQLFDDVFTPKLDRDGPGPIPLPENLDDWFDGNIELPDGVEIEFPAGLDEWFDGDGEFPNDLSDVLGDDVDIPSELEDLFGDLLDHGSDDAPEG